MFTRLLPWLENGICDFAERCEESNGDCIGGEGGCGFNRLCVEYNPNNGAEQETCAQICDSESNAAWYRIECPRNNNNFQYLDHISIFYNIFKLFCRA